jgi:hypothetical protein
MFIMYCLLQSAFWSRAVQCGFLCHDFLLAAVPFQHCNTHNKQNNFDA